MVCRLCLSDAEGNIVIFSEDKIQKYIAKFLQIELSTEDQISKVICTCCWLQLENFHNFCLKVEQAQQTLKSGSIDIFMEKSKLSSKECSQNQLKSSSPNFNVLKEDLLEQSDADDYDETLNSPEIPHEQILESKVATRSVEEIEHFPNQRRTRRSTIQKYQYEEVPEINLVQRKRGRPKKEEKQVMKEDDKIQFEIKKEELEVVEKESIEIKDVESVLNDVASESNVKRRRGRPRKGEQIAPKVKRPRSEQCSKMLQTAKEFDEIIQKHMNLSCNICSVRLIDFAELKRHFRAVHQRRGYAVCCNKRLFKRGLVVDHINVHNNPEHFKCVKCGKILADRMCLRNHDLLFHQTEELKTFQCPYCPKKYAKQYLLDHHTVKHVPQDECTFFCAECGKGFPTNSTLTKHVNQIHSTVYDKMCEICAKLIRGKANFERHMEEHEGIVQPQVQCKQCGSWLKDKNSLRKHMYKHDGKTHTCNICGKIAPSKSALQSHMRYVHQLSRMFHCTYCEKSFKKAVNLKEHMTTHTGEVLYTCPHCPKTFNSKANMHSHRKKKHREEWEANRRYPKKEVKTEVT